MKYSTRAGVPVGVAGPALWQQEGWRCHSRIKAQGVDVMRILSSLEKSEKFICFGERR